MAWPMFSGKDWCLRCTFRVSFTWFGVRGACGDDDGCALVLVLPVMLAVEEEEEGVEWLLPA